MNHVSRTIALGFASALAAGLVSAENGLPEVTSVTMSQGAHRLVTIQYTLENAPAIVTVDVKTNAMVNGASTWLSIGGEHIWNAEGDVWKKVGTAGGAFNGTITWRPDLSWTDAQGNGFTARNAKVEVTAWPLYNKPDYMVVDLTLADATDKETYYPSADFLPGAECGQKDAVVSHDIYKTTHLVMRKIMAKGVTWSMGTIASPMVVTLTNNYYMGVFEVTQAQWYRIKGAWFDSWFTSERARRPVEQVTYNAVRMSSNYSWGSYTGAWPEPPYSGSFLGQLNAKTGLDFDLPSTAQWEFACRAGHGDGYWNDGLSTAVSDGYHLGRFKDNGGVTASTGAQPPYNTLPGDGGTDIVGRHAPNSWGLYDTLGNVSELCLNYGTENDGHGTPKVIVPTTAGFVAARGGSFNSNATESTPVKNDARYVDGTSNYKSYSVGFRVMCRAGLD